MRGSLPCRQFVTWPITGSITWTSWSSLQTFIMYQSLYIRNYSLQNTTNNWFNQAIYSPFSCLDGIDGMHEQHGHPEQQGQHAQHIGHQRIGIQNACHTEHQRSGIQHTRHTELHRHEFRWITLWITRACRLFVFIFYNEFTNKVQLHNPSVLLKKSRSRFLTKWYHTVITLWSPFYNHQILSLYCYSSLFKI